MSLHLVVLIFVPSRKGLKMRVLVLSVGGVMHVSSAQPQPVK